MLVIVTMSRFGQQADFGLFSTFLPFSQHLLLAIKIVLVLSR